jgi:hypothetical protein
VQGEFAADVAVLSKLEGALGFRRVMGLVSARKGEQRRVLVGAIVALLIHVPVFVALRPAGARERRAEAAAVRASLRAERAALLRTAEADLTTGRRTLGETLIRLGWLDHAEDAPAETTPAERDRAVATYRAMLDDVRASAARGEPVQRAIVDAVARDGRGGRYKRMYPRLSDALANGGGNCVALSTLAVSLAYDAGRGDAAAFRVYSNHVAPDVGGFHFGMVKRCHGPGEKLAAKELLGAYVKARATGDREPFAFPRAEESCDDPGDVFGDLQLVGLDPPPLPAAGASGPSDASGGSNASGASGARGTATAPGREAECRRRTVLEEYEEDVELLGADGRSLGGVGIPRAASLDLAGHATSAACFDRRALAMPDASEPEALVLALGDAAMAAEDAARVFASAGEIDVAREYERRLAGHRARAAAPLERVIAKLGDANADTSATLAGAGRLVALGEGGRTAMLLASERHRGFWELANLMTRPSSQLGAVKRWSEKPVDVRLDVIDALPCASETFLAQLDTIDLPAARALRAGCEVRSRVDKERCTLDEGLPRAAGRARTAGQDAVDLAEAVLVRHLAARCRTPEFAASARRWAATKPEPVARAVASRIASE